MNKLFMKAPAGTTGATIEGHEYELSKKGVIQVKNETHIETLKRHGFVETDGETEEPKWDKMEDEELVTYIEEHGGDADISMSNKKLMKLAKACYAETQED